MKRLLFVFLSVWLAQAAFAQGVWTVETVPNTRLQGNEIHVSDPDGYLSDSVESVINTSLCDIRDKADVFVVTLYSIGDSNPKSFATSLFNYWGIGDAETDNGVLLLFVEDQRALEFETGYGAEAILTDAHCAKIFNQAIVPYFKAGDYEGGLCSGIAEIVEIYGGEVSIGLMDALASHNNDAKEDSEDVMSGFGAAFILLFLLPVVVISFLRWPIGYINNRGKKDPDVEELQIMEKEGFKFFEVSSTKGEMSVWKKKGFLRFLLYGALLVFLYILAEGLVPDFLPDAKPATQNSWATGITMLVYLSLTCIIQNLMELKKADAMAKTSQAPRAVYKKAKNDAHSMMMRIFAPWLGVFFGMAFRKRIKNNAFRCPTCGQPMGADEVDAIRIPASMAMEQKLGAYAFTNYRCPSGHQFMEREHGSNYNSVSVCQCCGTRAAKQTHERTVKAATYISTGLKEVTYTCQYCQKTFVKNVNIPKLVHSSSSSSRYHGSRSHSSGGSFGGGRSGGGGYSGRW